MTQPQHPFTDLPEGASVWRQQHGQIWRIDVGRTNLAVIPRQESGRWIAFHVKSEELFYSGPTPNEAFQALRAAVRDMANDLGVV